MTLLALLLSVKEVGLFSQNKSDSNELASVATHPDTRSIRITLQVSKSMLSNKAISRHISNVKSSSSHLFKKVEIILK